jgi:hypothetical protein
MKRKAAQQWLPGPAEALAKASPRDQAGFIAGVCLEVDGGRCV